jgi:hypothetical protein
VALGAAEVLVAGVRLHVGPQVGPVGEGLAAVGAPVRLLPRVRAEVALQQPRPGELLAADAAAVGQLVREQVHRQGGHADVGLAARHALLRRLRVQTPVGLLVPRQVAGGGVLPPALAARVAVQLGGGRVRRLQGLAVGGVVGVLLHHLVELLQKNYCQFGTHRATQSLSARTLRKNDNSGLLRTVRGLISNSCWKFQLTRVLRSYPVILQIVLRKSLQFLIIKVHARPDLCRCLL